MIVENEVRFQNGINLLLKLLVTIMAILQLVSLSFSFFFFLSGISKNIVAAKAKKFSGHLQGF